MADQVQRFDIPTKPTLIEGFRAFRSYLERVADSQGKTLASVRCWRNPASRSSGKP